MPESSSRNKKKTEKVKAHEARGKAVHMGGKVEDKAVAGPPAAKDAKKK